MSFVGVIWAVLIALKIAGLLACSHGRGGSLFYGQ